MDGCTAICFVKHVKIIFVQVGVVCAAWWHLRELSLQSNNSCICTALCKTWTKTVLTCFTKIIAEQPSLTQLWTTNVPYERIINMLSSTDNNFMIFLFYFESFRIEFSVSSFNSHCTLYHKLQISCQYIPT